MDISFSWLRKADCAMGGFSKPMVGAPFMHQESKKCHAGRYIHTDHHKINIYRSEAIVPSRSNSFLDTKKAGESGRCGTPSRQMAMK